MSLEYISSVGPYEIDKPFLAKTLHGIATSATVKDTDDKVFIKGKRIFNKSNIEQMRREFDIGVLMEDHTVAFLDFFVEQLHPKSPIMGAFLVTEYAKSEQHSTLADIIETENKFNTAILDIGTKTRLLTQVGQSIDHLHRITSADLPTAFPHDREREKISIYSDHPGRKDLNFKAIHRDIKPSNVLLKQDKNGILQAYLSDFGSTNIVSGLEILNTRVYASPEAKPYSAIQNEEDIRSDTYSYGATAIQFLTGEIPHLQPFTIQDIQTLISNRYPDVNQQDSLAMATILAQATSHKKKDRPAFCAPIAETIEKILVETA